MDLVDRESVANTWPTAGASGVPFWVYSDQSNYQRELDRIFYGPYWHFIGIDTEIPHAGDYKRAVVGERSVLMVRADDGSISVLLNTCAHRGVELCQAKFGHQKPIVCPYHQWSYDLKGNLAGVPFRKGVQGQGGYPDDFDTAQHGLTKLAVENVNGVVFASFDPEVRPFEEAVGPAVYGWFTRLFNGRKIRVLGYHRQRLKCNWKLYMENLKDSYHATLLHVFLISFGLYRAGQKGLSLQDDHTFAHSIQAATRTEQKEELGAESEMKSLRENLVLQDSGMLAAVKEFPDDTTLVNHAIFPNFVAQQQSNSLQIRHVIPLGVDEFELSWTYFGYEDDDEEMTLRRLRQANLTGPAGYISVDDSEVLEFSGAGIRPNPNGIGVLQMGGRAPVSPNDSTMPTSEGPIRGFYHHYCRVMGFVHEA
jgi:salicylate 5-hydroxylase large subunit